VLHSCALTTEHVQDASPNCYSCILDMARISHFSTVWLHLSHYILLCSYLSTKMKLQKIYLLITILLCILYELIFICLCSYYIVHNVLTCICIYVLKQIHYTYFWGAETRSITCKKGPCLRYMLPTIQWTPACAPRWMARIQHPHFGLECLGTERPSNKIYHAAPPHKSHHQFKILQGLN